LSFFSINRYTSVSEPLVNLSGKRFEPLDELLHAVHWRLRFRFLFGSSTYYLMEPHQDDASLGLSHTIMLTLPQPFDAWTKAPCTRTEAIPTSYVFPPRAISLSLPWAIADSQIPSPRAATTESTNASPQHQTTRSPPAEKH
jgi:hypothetical protein